MDLLNLGLTYDMLFVLFVLIIAMYLFVSGIISLEISAITILVVLIMASQFSVNYESWHLPPPHTLFEGFINPALITILCLLVVGEALTHSGVFDLMAKSLVNSFGHRRRAFFSLILSLVVGLSSILNNTPVVIMFIPVISGIAQKLNLKESKMMLPLSYASIFGGMITLIGSSTNLLVVSILISFGEPGLSFFSFTIPGLFMAFMGLIFLSLTTWLLPSRDSLTKVARGQFYARITISSDSKFIGQLITEIPEIYDIEIRSLHRDGHSYLYNENSPFLLKAKDELVLNTTRAKLEEIASMQGNLLPIDLVLNNSQGKINSNDEINSFKKELNQSLQLVELIVLPNSALIGRSISDVSFFENFGARIVALERRTRMAESPKILDKIALDAGDVLLAIASETQLVELRGNPDLLMVEWATKRLRNPIMIKPTLVISALTILLIASSIVPAYIAGLLGVVLILLTKTLSLDDALRSLDRTIIFVIATGLALGKCLESTEIIALLANYLLPLIQQFPLWLVLSFFFLLVSISANFLTSKPSAILFTPLAIILARSLEVEIEPFIIAVIFGANCAFASPFGYQTNLLVLGPGNYQFSDFIKYGSLLTIWSFIAFLFLARYYFY